MAKKQRVTASTVAERLRVLDLPHDCGIDVFAPAIIDCFRYSDCFIEFDEHYCRFVDFCGGRWSMVRRVRNSLTWGPLLSAANAAKPPRVARVAVQYTSG